MNIEQGNLNLFHFINASENASEFTIKLAIFVANDLLYLVVLGFLIAWLKGSFAVKKQIVKATIFTLIAFIVSQLISNYFYYHRPFVAEIGRTIIEHAPSGSFPSDHMLFFSTIAFSYLFSQQKRIGYIFLILAWFVAWSRVYLGVHYPLDMIGAFTLALLLNLVGISIWQKYGNYLVSWILKVYQYAFSKFIKKGYIR
ncbi:phosphatase PAP2 family protein [Acinetobacter sp. NBRC 110496]|uniref:phosphatase PAP2 family protein n=1 Tax=Acinetobacter sp. NBRC 110496 TaxID=1550715 RepID=UPI0005C4A867|nr:phosphatase PAP2 family protein [Acinetobacter sp. NBRC 110496]